MFERLMNLDVELRCLATKAFVAKEEVKDKVFYPNPKKNPDKKDEEKAKESKESDTKLSPGAEKACNTIRSLVGANCKNTSTDDDTETEEVPNIKETFDKLGEALEEAAKIMDAETLAELNNEMKEAIKDIASGLQDYADQKNKEQQPVQNVVDVQVVHPANSSVAIAVPVVEKSETVSTAVPVVEKSEPVVTGMDFSALQQGVSYENPQNSILTQPSQPPEGRAVTQDDVSIALANANQNQQPADKPKKK